MMLQNTGLRIKRFITQRPYKNVQNLGYESDNPRISDYQISLNGSKRSSWLSETPSTESIALQRTDSNSTIRSHIHHSNTAHSSASSLYSCDCKENPVPIEQSLSRVEAPPISQEVLYRPSDIPNNASDDAKSWRLIFPESLPPAPTLSLESKPHTRKPFLAITPLEEIGELSLPDFDNDKTPTQSIKYISDPFMDDLSANVEQLIREKDEAFKAVGTALAEAKAATGWYDTKLSPVTRPFSISRGIMRQSRSPVPVSPHRSPITKSKTKPFPKSKIVVTKGKPKPLRVKGGKKKSTLFNRTKSPRPQVQSSTMTSRWTLNDVTANMVDVFSGRRFRMEADEMLTPTRIQKLKDQLQIAAAKNERRISKESTRSNISSQTDGDEDVESLSPTEPFHLEELSERIDAVNRAGTPPSILTTNLNISPIDTTDETTPTAQKVNMKEIDIAFPFPPTPQPQPDMIFESFAFPAPPPIPPRNPRRVSSLGKGLPLLPTIPEISPLNLSPTPFLDFLLDHTPSSPSTPIHTPTPPPYILLPSAKYSLLAPNFQHGDIRIERLKTGKEVELRADEKESLDWVAFQMAISGNMDEYVGNERSDSEWELDEVEIDEILNWWESFGFSIGGFVDQEEEMRILGVDRVVGNGIVEVSPPSGNEGQEPKSSPKELEDLISTTSAEDSQEPAPPYQLTPSSPLPSTPESSNLTVPHNHIVTASEERRPSTASSMPPSPMLDLGLLSPKDDDVVPMGFNLGHDLEVFLSWETRNVRAFAGDE